jgi:hypothetical protein
MITYMKCLAWFSTCALVFSASLGCSGDSSNSDGAGNADGGIDSSFITPDAPPDPDCVAMACGGTVACVDGDSIQSAIDSTASGGTIQVAAGTYSGDLTISGKTLTVRGGFAAGGDFSSCNRTQNPTILDGSGSDAVVTFLNAGDSVLENFTITGGTGHESGGDFEGGGVFVDGGSVRIAYNLIENNTTIHNNDYNGAHGGGIGCDGDCDIVRNTIRNNRAHRGGGVSGSGNVLLEGNTIVDNTGEQDHCGGVYLVGGTFEVANNFIAGNEIGVTSEYNYGWGGGVYVGDNSTAMLHGNVVTDNYAASIGSGVFIDNDAHATLVNELYYANRCAGTGGAGFYADNLSDGASNPGSIVEIVNSTIADHDCAGVEGGNGIFIEGAGTTVTVSNSIFWNNGGEDFYARDGDINVSYSISQQSWSGTGNLNMDPRFADPSAGDYHLQSTAGRFSNGSWVTDSADSPAIDSGDPAAPYSAEPTPNGGRVNMGSHGNTGEASKSN